MNVNNNINYSCVIIISICICMQSCENEKDVILLNGNIASKEFRGNRLTIYVDSQLSYLSLSNSKIERQSYNGLSWLNTRNTFVGSKLSGFSERLERSYILEFDLTGKIIDTLFISDEGENIWPVYASRNDRYILFTSSKKADPEEFPFEGLSPMLTLTVLNLNTQNITYKLDSVGRSPNFQVKESPWLYDDKGFVYSIESYARLEANGVQINSSNKLDGIYLFNLETGQIEFLIPQGSKPVASPKRNEIAYEKNNSIRVFNLNSKKERIIFKYQKDDDVKGMHWTPDGNFLYFVHVTNNFLKNFFGPEEKLVNVSSGEQIIFKGNELGLKQYTWR